MPWSDPLAQRRENFHRHRGRPLATARTEWYALTGIILMAVLSSVLAGQFFLVGVRTVGVSRTVVFVYLVPVLTALMSTALLGEPFALTQGVGGAAVLAGVFWSTRGAA